MVATFYKKRNEYSPERLQDNRVAFVWFCFFDLIYNYPEKNILSCKMDPGSLKRLAQSIPALILYH